MFASIPSLPQD